MVLKQIFNVENNRLIINLPKSFKDSKRVMVVVDDDINSREGKIILMKQASSDPLYLADIEEVEEDFNFADAEEK